MVALPMEPPPSLVPFAPAAERTLPLYGGVAHLALLPERRQRSGHDREAGPAFAPSPAARILREESCWQDGGLCLTPNKFPFAREHRILWMAGPAREPDVTFWRAAMAWVDGSGGTALLNNIGAAATIPRAHAHLIGETLPWLSSVAERPLQTDLIDVPAGCQLVRKELPFCAIGARGRVAARAAALLALADARRTPTWNVVLERDVAWVVPRSRQTPAPWFEHPLGAAEVWGRWCYVDEAAYARATSADLEQALVAATLPAID